MRATFALLFAAPAAFALAACDDNYGYAPARYPTTTTEPVATATAQTQSAAPNGDPNGIYASDEVTVGADDAAPATYVDTDPSALTDFHESLDPYGQWVDDPNYGMVWVPAASAVGPDFVPYVSSGHWTYETDYVWVSDYDWGWAPFHYGRWVYVAGIGWAWIPGRTYAGAWVVWRAGNPGYGYVGWAPAPPLWVWRGGVAVGIGVVPAVSYTFCGTGDVFAPSVAGHVVRGAAVAGIAQNTRPWTPASPSVGAPAGSGPGRISPPLGGPPPSHLGLDTSKVPRPAAGDVGLARATQAARPISRPSLSGGSLAPSGGAPSGSWHSGSPTPLPPSQHNVPTPLPQAQPHVNPTPLPQAQPHVNPMPYPQAQPHVTPTPPTHPVAPATPPPVYHPSTPQTFHAPSGGGRRR